MRLLSIDEQVSRFRDDSRHEDGCWRSCSGCLEHVDGRPVGYPFNPSLGCYPGSGCRECGGIGAIWDTTDWDDAARALAGIDHRPEVAVPLTASGAGPADILARARDLLTRNAGVYQSDEALTFRALLAIAEGSGGLSLRHEAMNDAFHKWHIEGLPFPAALHRFTAPDAGDPHDHPWRFTSFVLIGGYEEEVWHRWPGTDEWRTERVRRFAGTVHKVEAEHIHRIVGLPPEGCWTLVLPGEPVRQPHFWRFINGAAQNRPWWRAGFEAVA